MTSRERLRRQRLEDKLRRLRELPPERTTNTKPIVAPGDSTQWDYRQ